MKLFSSIAAGIVALTGMVSPAMAYTQQEFDNHAELFDTVQSLGVPIYINHRQACDPKSNGGVNANGWYAVMNNGAQVIIVCQENGTPGGPQVEWTANDLDTLRHEAWHMIQDCADGRQDMSLDLILDGGKYSNGVTRVDVILALGNEKAQRIIYAYTTGGASEEIVLAELEAFAVAANVPVTTITNYMNGVCGV